MNELVHFDLEQKRKLDKVFCDMFEGDGKMNPPMIARMASAEETIEIIKHSFGKVVWIAIGMLATFIGDVVYHWLW